MTHRSARTGLAQGLLALLAAAPSAGCGGATPTDIVAEQGVCPQTYEFGNQGCAVVVRLDEPVMPWPQLYRVELTARPATADLRVRQRAAARAIHARRRAIRPTPFD